MYPTWREIEVAAYERWERGGRSHGADRDDWSAAEMDLTFQKNYRPIAEYPLAASGRLVIGAISRPSCRFCERSAPRAGFREPRPIAPAIMSSGPLCSTEICDECHEQFASGIDRDFAVFWESLADPAHERGGYPPRSIPIGAYKSLVRMAISIMPERDLSQFVDTLEWVGNPDHDFDRSLFADAGCLVYRTRHPQTVPWAALFRSVNPDAPLPHVVFILAAANHAIQLAPPLCAQDQENDAPEGLRLLPRSFTTGYGHAMASASRRLLPLERAERSRRRVARLTA